jgi:hypothetical protein
MFLRGGIDGIGMAFNTRWDDSSRHVAVTQVTLTQAVDTGNKSYQTGKE